MTGYDNDDLPCIQAGPIRVPMGHPEYVAVVESDEKIRADIEAIYRTASIILEEVHWGKPEWTSLTALEKDLNKGMVLYELALMLPNWPDDDD